jgi:hypothetical protein
VECTGNCLLQVANSLADELPYSVGCVLAQGVPELS